MPGGFVGSGLAISVGGVQRAQIGSSTQRFEGNLFVTTGGVHTTSPSTTGDIWAFGGGQIISGQPGTAVSGAGLIRATDATTLPPAADWEDGHLGNSSELVFTPSDFVSGDISNNSAVQSSQPDPGSRNSRWYGLIDNSGIVLAQKIVPNGFIIDGSETITIFTPNASMINTTCYVSAQAVNIGSTTTLTHLLSTTIIYYKLYHSTWWRRGCCWRWT